MLLRHVNRHIFLHHHGINDFFFFLNVCKIPIILAFFPTFFATNIFAKKERKKKKIDTELKCRTGE